MYVVDHCVWAWCANRYANADCNEYGCADQHADDGTDEYTRRPDQHADHCADDGANEYAGRPDQHADKCSDQHACARDKHACVCDQHACARDRHTDAEK